MTGTGTIVEGIAELLAGCGYKIFTENVKQYRGAPAAVIAVSGERIAPAGPRLVERSVTAEVTSADGDYMTNEGFYRFSEEMMKRILMPVSFDGRCILPENAELLHEGGRGICRFVLRFLDDAEETRQGQSMEELVI